MAESSSLTTIEVTVMKSTADALNQMAESAGMTTGEAIDRLTLHLSPNDPELAANIVMEEMLHVFSRLNEKDFGKAMTNIILTVGAIMPDDVILTLPSAIKKKQRELNQYYQDLPKEEWERQYADFQTLLREIYHDHKD